MTVASLIDGSLVPAPAIVVCPCSVIPLVMFTTVGQLNVPAGSVMVSPSCAKLSCKYCTLAAVPSDGQMVVAKQLDAPKKNIDAKMGRRFFIRAFCVGQLSALLPT